MSNLLNLGPAIADCLKDANTPVRMAAERCALHVFQLTKGSPHPQPPALHLLLCCAMAVSIMS